MSKRHRGAFVACVENLPCSETVELDRFWLEFSAVIPWLGEERKAMKASRFSDAQKAFILKQGADGMPVAGMCPEIFALSIWAERRPVLA